jgi:LPS export ABC transporter protein LptC
VSTGRAGSRRFRNGLLLAMAISLAGLAGTYIAYRQGADPGDETYRTPTSGAGLTIENLRHTAAREGKTEWQLQAATARLTPDRTEAQLDRLSAVFFLDDGTRVEMTADEGRLETGSNDLEVAGNVVLTNDGYRLTTDKLRYGHKKRKISAPGPVAVSGGAMKLTADSATFDLESRKFHFEGSVHGIIDRKLAL